MQQPCFVDLHKRLHTRATKRNERSASTTTRTSECKLVNRERTIVVCCEHIPTAACARDDHVVVISKLFPIAEGYGNTGSENDAEPVLANVMAPPSAPPPPAIL